MLATIAFASCSGSSAKPAPPAPSALDARLLEIAREYLDYGRVDDQNRWSPTLCALKPSEARFSESDDASTHGRKIYYVFARYRDAYVNRLRGLQPDGQVLVKEAWTPVPLVESEIAGKFRSDAGGRYTPNAALDGRQYTLGPKAGLFIMLKRGGGWTYATVTPEGDRVIQSGQLTSCIGCHRDAKPDSLFGLPGRTQDR